MDRVEAELLEMFANPELRKRYFAIVDLAEIQENEFNLNIPRYVNTFEPEEQIDLGATTKAFVSSIENETKLADLLQPLTLVTSEFAGTLTTIYQQQCDPKDCLMSEKPFAELVGKSIQLFNGIISTAGRRLARAASGSITECW